MIESDLELSTTMLLINRRMMTVIKTMQGITKCQLYRFLCSERRLTFLKQQKKRGDHFFQHMQLKSSIQCKNQAGNFLRTVTIKTEVIP